MMINFMSNNWITIIAALALIGYILYLLINRRWSKLRELAHKMIRQAESVIIGTKKGKERFNLVFSQLYNIVPAWLRFFIPRSLLRQKLQEWFDMIKDSLEDGKINK